MASESLEEASDRVACEAAVEFAEGYYESLNTDRKSLEHFYIPLGTGEAVAAEPLITWNGHVIDDPVEFRKMMEDDFGFMFYNCHSVDAQVVNNSYYKDQRTKGRKPEENISILVITSGSVRLQERGSGPMKQFSETFVLVPNAVTRNQRGPQKRRFLIQSQMLRWVVSHEDAGVDKMEAE